jgi:cell division topological specificity factor
LGKRRPTEPVVDDSRSSAVNRLKLVLMHDRTQISPDTLTKMRDELVEVISKYVEIDQDALELNLEGDSNTIALMANIPVLRARVG